MHADEIVIRLDKMTKDLLKIDENKLDVYRFQEDSELKKDAIETVVLKLSDIHDEVKSSENYL